MILSDTYEALQTILGGLVCMICVCVCPGHPATINTIYPNCWCPLMHWNMFKTYNFISYSWPSFVFSKNWPYLCEGLKHFFSIRLLPNSSFTALQPGDKAGQKLKYHLTQETSFRSKQNTVTPLTYIFKICSGNSHTLWPSTRLSERYFLSCIPSSSSSSSGMLLKSLHCFSN